MITLNDEEKSFAVRGDKISAILSLRKRSGLGLLEAKDVIEAFMYRPRPGLEFAGEELVESAKASVQALQYRVRELEQTLTQTQMELKVYKDIVRDVLHK